MQHDRYRSMYANVGHFLRRKSKRSFSTQSKMPAISTSIYIDFHGKMLFSTINISNYSRLNSENMYNDLFRFHFLYLILVYLFFSSKLRMLVHLWINCYCCFSSFIMKLQHWNYFNKIKNSIESMKIAHIHEHFSCFVSRFKLL